VRKFLQTDEPPEYAQHDADRAQLFQRVWAVSKPWRFDNVEDAVRRTEARGARGLQRTELFRSLGRSLGISPNVSTIGVPEIINWCSWLWLSTGVKPPLDDVSPREHSREGRSAG
jgi:hypothetical protein